MCVFPCEDVKFWLKTNKPCNATDPWSDWTQVRLKCKEFREATWCECFASGKFDAAPPQWFLSNQTSHECWDVAGSDPANTRLNHCSVCLKTNGQQKFVGEKESSHYSQWADSIRQLHEDSSSYSFHNLNDDFPHRLSVLASNHQQDFLIPVQT